MPQYTADLADHAIKYIEQQNSLAPDKPFFVYYAPGMSILSKNSTFPCLGFFSIKKDRPMDGAGDQFPSLYLSVLLTTGATHAPHHAPQEWIDKFKGAFDLGWDQVE